MDDLRENLKNGYRPFLRGNSKQAFDQAIDYMDSFEQSDLDVEYLIKKYGELYPFLYFLVGELFDEIEELEKEIQKLKNEESQ